MPKLGLLQLLVVSLQVVNLDPGPLQLLSHCRLDWVVVIELLDFLRRFDSHEEVFLDELFHVEDIFDHGVHSFSAFASAAPVIVAKVSRRLQRYFTELQLGRLKAKLLLEVVHHFDAIDNLTLTVLARMNIEVVPHEQLSVKTRLKYLLLQIIPQVQHL